VVGKATLPYGYVAQRDQRQPDDTLCQEAGARHDDGMAVERDWNGSECAKHHGNSRCVTERAVPGTVTAQGYDDGNEDEGATGRQHVQLENARKRLVDDEQIVGERDGAKPLRYGDDTRRDGQQQDAANGGKTWCARSKLAHGGLKAAGGKWCGRRVGHRI